MSKRSNPSVPDQNRIEELLAKIQPIPSEHFHLTMQQAAWRVEGQRSVKNVRLRVAFAIFFLAALATLFVTPQGRAWAQEVFQFFSRINSLTIELPENQLKALEDISNSYELPLVPVFIPTVSPEMAALPGCETPERSQSYGCQVALAESQLGFDLKELPEKPDDWKFDSLRFDIASKSATINYMFDLDESWVTTYSTLSLIQGIGDFPGFYKDSPWGMVPDDKVEVVSVGNAQGEYVKGSFSKPADRDTLVWNDSNNHQRLAWSDGTRWYLIELWRNLNVPDPLGRGGLIELAESLTDSSLETVEPLDPDFLYSVADAEEISGFDLKTPTLLPIETRFSYARYYPSTKQVRLFYGVNHELVIYQQEDRSLDSDTLSTSHPGYEILEVNGKDALFGSGRDSDPYVFLWWQQDGFFYQMYFYEYMDAKLDKEKMVAIAESMQDIDDFRTNDPKPYEYVSIYGRALGFEPREFSTTLRGWSYVDVWPDPSARCIYLIYTSTTEEVDLFINQCGTSKRFNIIDAPAGSIERVRIGRNPGRYIAGSFIPADNGEMLWDPAAPAKGLLWQDDDLWIQLSIVGNSVSLYDKEELISIAESLR